MVGPAAAGRRAQSNSPPYLRTISRLRAPKTRRGRNGEHQPAKRQGVHARLRGLCVYALECFSPAQRPCHPRSAGGRKTLRQLRRLFGRAGNVQRGRRGARAGSADRSAARLVGGQPSQHRQGDAPPGAAVGQARPAGIPAAARTQGSGRHRAAGRRLLAHDAAAPRRRRARAVAIRLPAAARRRDGAGITARRSAVQDLRSGACERDRHAVHTPTNRATEPAEEFSGARAARAAAGLPHPVQGRCRR